MKTLPLPETYGYHIIQTKEERERFKPKLETDQTHYGEDDGWDFDSRTVFLQGLTYRRRIDVGEGWRLVELDEVVLESDEYALVSKPTEWFRYGYSDTNRTVSQTFVKKNGTDLIFRRRVEVKEGKAETVQEALNQLRADNEKLRILIGANPYEEGYYDGYVTCLDDISTKLKLIQLEKGRGE